MYLIEGGTMEGTVTISIKDFDEMRILAERAKALDEFSKSVEESYLSYATSRTPGIKNPIRINHIALCKLANLKSEFFNTVRFEIVN